MDEAVTPERNDTPVRRETAPPRVHSVRSFLLELLTITAGVLIALSVDSLREWQQHRSLAREARQTIAREMADNRREVDAALAAAPDRDRRLDAALRLANELLAGTPSASYEIELGLGLSEMSRTGWQSAERTGALSHMEYGEVQKYARIYALQELYESTQRRAVEHLSAALALFSQNDPTAAPRADVEVFRREVLALRAELTFLDQFGEQLTKGYEHALKH
jgi:hypothetical protein